MHTIGLDLHKRESQLCVGHDDGSVEERRIATSRERFTAVLGEQPPARVLVEASTESERVARHLEAPGHEVIVAHPNFAPMYATRSRRTRHIALAKALVRRDGLRVAASEAHLVAKRIASFGAVDWPDHGECRRGHR